VGRWRRRRRCGFEDCRLRRAGRRHCKRAPGAAEERRQLAGARQDGRVAAATVLAATWRTGRRQADRVPGRRRGIGGRRGGMLVRERRGCSVMDVVAVRLGRRGREPDQHCTDERERRQPAGAAVDLPMQRTKSHTYPLGCHASRPASPTAFTPFEANRPPSRDAGLEPGISLARAGSKASMIRVGSCAPQG
jgi:hypothetical protein